MKFKKFLKDFTRIVEFSANLTESNFIGHNPKLTVLNILSDIYDLFKESLGDQEFSELEPGLNTLYKILTKEILTLEGQVKALKENEPIWNEDEVKLIQVITKFIRSEKGEFPFMDKNEIQEDVAYMLLDAKRNKGIYLGGINKNAGPSTQIS